jgi:hypothetical protein
VALPEEEIPGAEDLPQSIGGSKDLLYGWLVGRAAADLGLAHALAASEAQRSEQIKRLEESLLGQIRELYQRQAGSEGGTALEAIRAELCRVDQEQRQMAAERIGVAELESSLRQQIDRLESQIQQRSQAAGSADFGDLRFELKLLVDRVARAEHAAQQAQNRAAAQHQEVERIVAERLAVEVARVETALAAKLQEMAPVAAIAQSVEASLSHKLDELRAEVGRRTGMASELASLTGELGHLSARLRQLEAAPDIAAHLVEQEGRWKRELDARLAGVQRSAQSGMANLSAEISALKTRLAETERPSVVDESLAARVAALDAKLALALDREARRDAELAGLTGQLNLVSGQLAELSRNWDGQLAQTHAVEVRFSEWLAADQRITEDLNRLQLEFGALAQRAHEITEGLRSEMTGLKADLGQQAVVTAQSVLANVEENLASRLAILDSAVLRAQQESQGRDRRLNEIHSELQRVAQRLSQAESSAQQSHALAVNDAAQAAEQRDRVSNELSAVQNQLAEQRLSRVKLEGVGRELSAKLEQQEDQLSGAIAVLESRGAEIVEIKAQLQNLLQNSIQLAAPKPAPMAAAVSRLQTPVGVSVGLSAVHTPSEPNLPAAKSAPAEPASLLTSYDADAAVSIEQKKQLQQRISADIERVRAELRKRAGVSR